MQGGDVSGIVQMIGFFLVKAGGALIDNMAILFVIGVGVGMDIAHIQYPLRYHRLEDTLQEALMLFPISENTSS